MEIMITLSDCGEGSDHVISGRVLVIERSFAKPVSEGIDTKGGLSQIVQLDGPGEGRRKRT